MKITTAHIRRVCRTVRDDLRAPATALANAINQERVDDELPSIDAKPGHPGLGFRFGYGADPDAPKYHGHIDWCSFAGSVPTVAEVHALAHHPRLRVRWIEIEGWPRVRVTDETTGRRCDETDRYTDLGSSSAALWDDGS